METSTGQTELTKQLNENATSTSHTHTLFYLNQRTQDATQINPTSALLNSRNEGSLKPESYLADPNPHSRRKSKCLQH